MGTPLLTDAQLVETGDALTACGFNQTHAAERLNIHRSTLQGRMREMKRRGMLAEAPGGSLAVVPAAKQPPRAAPMPPSDIPFDERLAIYKRRAATRIAHVRAAAWQHVTIPVVGTYGICWFGDPHLDDDYCDLERLEADARICAATEGLYGANGGDSINNWIERALSHLYAHQSMSAEEGWELVEWFMHGLGVRWLLWLLGNHDVWNGGGRVFDKIGAQRILMRDWDAKMSLRSPCGGTARVWARHDFKGTSIYNELHGLKRAAMMDEQADIYAAFHRHSWGNAQGELAAGRRYTLIRAKGYKAVDDYALKKGFVQQEGGQSVVTVITPRPDAQPKISVFEDVAEGADFLTFKRRKEGA